MSAQRLPELTGFMRVYERDLSFLAEARAALLSHPLRPNLPDLYNPSACRLLAITAIGAIEHLLEAWNQEDPHGVLKRYFADGVTNRERVANLFEAFSQAGINLDRAVFDDYLAVKYLRNTIVHGRWKEDEKQWLQERGFPVDPDALTSAHWSRIQWVAHNMVAYVYRVFWPLAEALFQPAPDDQPCADLPPVLFEADFARVLWRNIERISSLLFKAFTATSDGGLIRASWTSKEEWWTALWRASRHERQLFAAQREVTDSALYSWDEYSRLRFESVRLSISNLQDAATGLRTVHEARDPAFGPLLWPEHVPTESARELLRQQLLPTASVDEDQAIRALALGAAAYSAMINVTPCYLFAIQLPIVDTTRVAECAPRARHALLAMEVSQRWKGLVDTGTVPDLSNLALFEKWLNAVESGGVA